MNTPDNLPPRVANLESLMEFMAETQRSLANNLQTLTVVLQKQDERISTHEEETLTRLSRHEEEMQIMRQMLKNYDETIVVMQGQIGLLLNKLLGNSRKILTKS